MNPLDGVKPSFTFLGIKFQSLSQLVLGGVWMAGIVAAIIFVIWGLIKLARGKNNPTKVEKAWDQLKFAGTGLVLLAGLSPVVAMLLQMGQNASNAVGK